MSYSDDLSSSNSAESSPLLGRRRSPAPVAIPSGKSGLTSLRTGTPYSASAPLVNPIMDETDIASSYGSESSAFLRRKEAASGGVGRYASLGNGINDPRSRPPPREIKDDEELDSSWFEVPSSSDHKREDHATT